MLKWPLMEQAGDAAAGGGGGQVKAEVAGAAAGADAGKAAAAAGADAGKAAAGADVGKAAAGAAAGSSAPGAEHGGKGYWPDDWLARVSKGDKKLEKQFGQYQSPEALAEAHVALRRRMDSGEFKAALPKDPKPDELAVWRKDNGIPDKAEGYDIKDLKVPDEDKDIVAGLLKEAHAANFTPAQAKVHIGSYYAEQKRQMQARSAKDEDQRVAALDALNQEWGGKFRPYINRIENILTKFPADVRDMLKAARLPDGTALFNNPSAMRGFLALSLESIPDGVVVPAGGGDLGKSMTDRYNEIAKYRRENRPEYNKDSKVQAEERSLIDAMIKQGLMDKNGNLIDAKKAA